MPYGLFCQKFVVRLHADHLFCALLPGIEVDKGHLIEPPNISTSLDGS